jgi:hypothetical protein
VLPSKVESLRKPFMEKALWQLLIRKIEFLTSTPDRPMLAEAGCTELEIASITGHSYAQVHRILEVYLPRTRALADAAIMKLERHTRRLQKVR